MSEDDTNPQQLQGPPGPPGDPGKQGPPGQPGEDGKDGRDGRDGKDGEDGQNGSNGADGKDGDDGKDGVDGASGRDGQNGKDGRDGENGKDGDKGSDGKNGKPGRDGKDGKQGPPGKDGRDSPAASLESRLAQLEREIAALRTERRPSTEGVFVKLARVFVAKVTGKQWKEQAIVAGTFADMTGGRKCTSNSAGNAIVVPPAGNQILLELDDPNAGTQQKRYVQVNNGINLVRLKTKATSVAAVVPSGGIVANVVACGTWDGTTLGSPNIYVLLKCPIGSGVELFALPLPAAQPYSDFAPAGSGDTTSITHIEVPHVDSSGSRSVSSPKQIPFGGPTGPSSVAWDTTLANNTAAAITFVSGVYQSGSSLRVHTRKMYVDHRGALVAIDVEVATIAYTPPSGGTP